MSIITFLSNPSKPVMLDDLSLEVHLKSCKKNLVWSDVLGKFVIEDKAGNLVGLVEELYDDHTGDMFAE